VSLPSPRHAVHTQGQDGYMCWLAPLLQPKLRPYLWRISWAKKARLQNRLCFKHRCETYASFDRSLIEQTRSSNSNCGRPGGRRMNAMSLYVSPKGVNTLRLYCTKYLPCTKRFDVSRGEGRRPGGRRIIANSFVSRSRDRSANKIWA